MSRRRRRSTARKAEQRAAEKPRPDVPAKNDADAPSAPDPPRPNKPLLIAAAVLQAVWLVFLLVLAAGL